MVRSFVVSRDATMARYVKHILKCAIQLSGIDC